MKYYYIIGAAVKYNFTEIIYFCFIKKIFNIVIQLFSHKHLTGMRFFSCEVFFHSFNYFIIRNALRARRLRGLRKNVPTNFSSFEGEINPNANRDDNCEKNNCQNDLTVLGSGYHPGQNSGASTQIVVSIS